MILRLFLSQNVGSILEKDFWEVFGENLGNFWEVAMRRKTYKGRCEKQTLPKFCGVCKTYDPVQTAYAVQLSGVEQITQIRCNVPLEGDTCGEYMSDFVCIKSDGDIMVRECCLQKHLTKPQTVRLLDMSRNYWLQHGVTDWGVVMDAAEE